MNDQILMDNYLLLLKSTVEVYIHGTLESSNQDIRNLLKKSLNDIISYQAETYGEMVNYDWYNIENVESNVINQTLSKIKSKN